MLHANDAPMSTDCQSDCFADIFPHTILSSLFLRLIPSLPSFLPPSLTYPPSIHLFLPPLPPYLPPFQPPLLIFLFSFSTISSFNLLSFIPFLFLFTADFVNSDVRERTLLTRCTQIISNESTRSPYGNSIKPFYIQ